MNILEELLFIPSDGHVCVNTGGAVELGRRSGASINVQPIII
jgi:hypothetical protein